MKIEFKEGYIRYVLVVGVIIVLATIGYFVKNISTGFLSDKDKEPMTKENVEVLYDAKEEKNIQEKGTNLLTTGDNKNSNLKVEIKGAVTNPGVYSVYEEDRVEDLVKLAGGFIANADKIRIRLASRLIDEELIYVYKVGEKSNTELLEMGIDNHLAIDKPNSSQNSNQNSKNDKININTATKEQLMTLPGIGDVKASSIITYREERNGFKSIDELKNVSGIGEKTLAKFLQLVDIN